MKFDVWDNIRCMRGHFLTGVNVGDDFVVVGKPPLDRKSVCDNLQCMCLASGISDGCYLIKRIGDNKYYHMHESSESCFDLQITSQAGAVAYKADTRIIKPEEILMTEKLVEIDSDGNVRAKEKEECICPSIDLIWGHISGCIYSN